MRKLDHPDAGLAIWSHYSPAMAARSGANLLSLLHAGVFVLIGVGLFFNSRTAAVVGLAFYLLERALALTTTSPGAVMLIVVLVVGFVGGVRGTFPHHRYLRNRQPLPNAPIEPV